MLDIRGKFLESMPDGSPKGCRVILGNDEGAVIPVLLPAEFQDKSQSETLEAALDKHYEQTFPNRAEKEQFHHIDESLADVEKSLKSLDKRQTALDKALKAMEAQVVNLKSAGPAVKHEVEIEIEED